MLVLKYSWTYCTLHTVDTFYPFHTVIRFVWFSAKYGTCTVVSINGTLFEDKMRSFNGECTNFSLNKCLIYTHVSASAKFSTNAHETDNSASIQTLNNGMGSDDLVSVTYLLCFVFKRRHWIKRLFRKEEEHSYRSKQESTALYNTAPKATLSLANIKVL
jgi:hypothetical protein